MLDERNLVKAMAFIRLWEIKDILTEEFINSNEQLLNEFKGKTINEIIYICNLKGIDIDGGHIGAIVDQLFAEELGREL